ncbi:MAG: hypothetical protein ABI318_07595 [Chthoniobacteraceae bacterium]
MRAGGFSFPSRIEGRLHVAAVMRESLPAMRSGRKWRPLSMTAPRPHLSGIPRAMGFAVLLHLLAVMWLAASPALHAAVHSDASEPAHSCCVTLFEAGSFHAPVMPAIFTAKVDLPLIERMQPVVERVIEIRFSLGVLEHAPPATA